MTQQPAFLLSRRLALICGSSKSYYPSGHPSDKLIAGLSGQDGAPSVIDVPVPQNVVMANNQEIQLRIFCRYANLTKFGPPLLQRLWENGMMHPASTSLVICASAYDQLGCYTECETWLRTFEQLVQDLVAVEPAIATPLDACKRERVQEQENAAPVNLGFKICIVIDEVTPDCADLLTCVRSLAVRYGATIMAIDLAKPTHPNFARFMQFLGSDDAFQGSIESPTELLIVGGKDNVPPESSGKEVELPSVKSPHTFLVTGDAATATVEAVGLQACLKACIESTAN